MRRLLELTIVSILLSTSQSAYAQKLKNDSSQAALIEGLSAVADNPKVTLKLLEMESPLKEQVSEAANDVPLLNSNYMSVSVIRDKVILHDKRERTQDPSATGQRIELDLGTLEDDIHNLLVLKHDGFSESFLSLDLSQLLYI